jgi:hypothetical protein
MRLPNANRAIVDIAKLRDYCLDPEHPRGKHKARVFSAALGLIKDDAEVLRSALFAAALTSNAQLIAEDQYGQRFVIDFEMTGPAGSATVRSAWIIRTGEDFPRLTSCYVV